MPSSHRPGEVQIDFGVADVIWQIQQRRVALFVMTLMYSDVVLC